MVFSHYVQGRYAGCPHIMKYKPVNLVNLYALSYGHNSKWRPTDLKPARAPLDFLTSPNDCWRSRAGCRAPAMPGRCPVDFPSVAGRFKVKTGRNLGASPQGVPAGTD